jgi:hypothetical protein
MSFKKFSSALDAPEKGGSDDKSRDSAAKDQPDAKPERTPADTAPVRKS